VVIMASLTIRNLDDNVKAALRLRAAQHGRSMEEEALHILQQSLEPVALGGCLAERIGRRFAGLDAEGLHVPPRRPSPVVPQVNDGC
jgi:antitoxin FitA